MASKITLWAKKEPTTPLSWYGRIFFDSAEMVWKIKHDTWTTNSLEVTANENIRMTGQTVDISVWFYDPVYLDPADTTWKRATSTTPRPTGVKTANDWEVVLFWRMSVSWFFSNKYFFLKNTWWLTIDESSTYIKIWYSLSADSFLVDIDIEQNANS